MVRRMTALFLTGVLLVVGNGCSRNQAITQPLWVGPSVGDTIGTYDRVELLVAYHKSDLHHQRLSGMVKERDEAKARGDQARVDELERQGQSMQIRSHRQLVGKEPLDNIAMDLGEALPRVAAKAGVWKIVDREAMATGTPHVDVTPLLIEHLPPRKNP